MIVTASVIIYFQRVERKAAAHFSQISPKKRGQAGLEQYESEQTAAKLRCVVLLIQSF